jgi:hypothetical protein
MPKKNTPFVRARATKKSVLLSSRVRGQITFLDSLSARLFMRFNETWMLRLAEHARGEIQAAPAQGRAETFRKHLHLAGNWILEQQASLISDLAKYAQANQHEFNSNEEDWMPGALEEIWSPIFTADSYRGWAMVACACDSGNAPAWLKEWNGYLPHRAMFQKNEIPIASLTVANTSAALSGHDEPMDEPETKTVVDRIANYFEILRLRAQRETINDAYIELRSSREVASEKIQQQWQGELLKRIEGIKNAPAAAPKKSIPARRLREPGSKQNKAILGVIRSNPTLEGIDYARALERAKISPPPAWINDDCPRRYPEAYMIEKWRKRINDQKYRISKFL